MVQEYSRTFYFGLGMFQCMELLSDEEIGTFGM